MALGGPRWHSVALGGTQRHSVALTCPEIETSLRSVAPTGRLVRSLDLEPPEPLPGLLPPPSSPAALALEAALALALALALAAVLLLLLLQGGGGGIMSLGIMSQVAAATAATDAADSPLATALAIAPPCAAPCWAVAPCWADVAPAQRLRFATDSGARDGALPAAVAGSAAPESAPY